MNAQSRDPLDGALAKVPRGVRPERDLWPDIRTRIEADAGTSDSRLPRARARLWQLAAGVLLVIASSLTTYVVIREPAPATTAGAQIEPPRPALVAMPASFAGERLGQDYLEARAELDAAFERRLASLPPAAREKVQRNLGDIRLAAREIADTLAQHPSDSLLQELLLSTYQNELRLMADVAHMAPAPAARVDL